MGKKREVEPFLKKLLEVDVSLTNRFCSWANNYTALRSIKNHARMLEYSCHGVPWFVSVLALMWLSRSQEMQHMEVNLLFGLLLDMIFVSTIKAAVRRRRPSLNQSDAFFMVGPDKFSFPSGHASRAMFLSLFYIYEWPVYTIFVPPLCAWALSVAISRILMRRHHILDVVCGVCVGAATAFLLNFLWISEDGSRWVYSYLSDEVLDGGSYHV